MTIMVLFFFTVISTFQFCFDIPLLISNIIAGAYEKIYIISACFWVVVGLAALLRMLSGIGGKPLLSVGVVGADMDKGHFSGVFSGA